MSALTAGVALLLERPSVTAIVANRIGIVLAPQQWIRPNIVLHLISTVDEPMLSGAGKYYRTRIQTDCNGLSASQAVLLGEEVMDTLNGVIKRTIGGCVDVDCLHSGTDMTEFSDTGTSFRRVLQFNMRWRRA